MSVITENLTENISAHTSSCYFQINASTYITHLPTDLRVSSVFELVQELKGMPHGSGGTACVHRCCNRTRPDASEPLVTRRLVGAEKGAHILREELKITRHEKRMRNMVLKCN